MLLDIDSDYLFLWGHYRLIAEMHERVQGKIEDRELRSTSLGNLGSVCRDTGQVQRAIVCYENALEIAQDIQDLWGEDAWLGNLGSCYANLGQTARAIEFYEQALAIAHEIGDRRNEDVWLGNLGNRYAELGQTARAIEYYEQAIVIDLEIGDRNGEGIDLSNLAYALIDEGRYNEAAESAQRSAEIGREISSPQVGNGANTMLALVCFYLDDLSAARNAAEVTKQYDYPQENAHGLFMLGLVALHQGDVAVARDAFTDAIAQADALLVHTPELFNVLDAKGVALAGLAVCAERLSPSVPFDKLRAGSPGGGEVKGGIVAAVAAFRAARAVNRDPGIVARVLRLLDALAVVDTDGILPLARAAAAGE